MDQSTLNHLMFQIQVEKDENGGNGRESLYWDGDLRNYYPEPKSQRSPDLKSQSDSAPGSQNNTKPKAQRGPVPGSQSDPSPGPQSFQGKDDIVIQQSEPPSEDGSDKGGPLKTKENLDEGKFEEATMPKQGYDPSYVDVNREPNVGKSNEYKTKNVSDDEGGKSNDNHAGHVFL